MEYILNYAAIFCFGISLGTLVHSLNSVSLMNSIFDKIGTYIRENVRDRNLFGEADYMRKLVFLKLSLFHYMEFLRRNKIRKL